MSQRWKITIEYKGTDYAGWQIQPEVKTVQGEIMDALSRMCKADITLYGAGRTDSGVHATGQVAHFDLLDNTPVGTNFSEYKMREALNYFIGKQDISILKAEKVGKNFHARFSATGRAYTYRISNRIAPLTYNKGVVWHTGGNKMNISRMHEAAQYLVGTHDFTSFRHFEATHQNPVRTIDYINVTEVGDEIHINIGSRSFLHNQVRYITAALQLVGYGHWEIIRIKEVLDAKSRLKGGPLAPPTGLFLTEVLYGEENPYLYNSENEKNED